jgi:tetratricopeptide (TPR) repeat protein
VRVVQAEMALNDPLGAERALLEFRRHHPDSDLLPEVLLDVALWRFERGDYNAAAQTWTDLIAAVTRNGAPGGDEDTAPRLTIVRSLSLWKQLQREARSRTEMERLARFNQALSWERCGDGDAALRAYDRFTSRFPQDARAAEARLRVASLVLERGDLEDALVGFRAVYRDSTAPAAFRCESVYRAGRCEEALRRIDAAAATYGDALPLQPADDEFRLASLAELAHLIEAREPTRAVAIYRELASVSTDTAVRAVVLQRLAILEGDSAPSP